MTRTEAIAIITTTLQAVDDQTLTAAAAHLAQLGAPSDITVGDIVGAAQTDSVLPRQLSAKELKLIEQSRADFRTGKTFSPDELDAFLDAAAATHAAARNQ